MKRLSVIIPTYNRAEFVGEALDSVAAQTVAPTEVIVIDDGSTDDTGERIRCHPIAERVRYHRLPENRGAAIARNVGVGLAQGDIVVFLDSDDVLEPDHHAFVLGILDARAEIGLCACDARVIDEKGRWLHAGRTYMEIQCRISKRSIETGRRSLKEVFLLSTLFAGCAVRRDLYVSVGGLDQGLFPLEDYDFQLRMAGADQALHYEHRPLARYRMHSRNSSGSRHAVFVQEQRLRCVRLAFERFPEIRGLGALAQRRIAEVRRELALAELKAGLWGRGFRSLIPALAADPSGFLVIARILSRKLGHLKTPRGAGL